MMIQLKSSELLSEITSLKQQLAEAQSYKADAERLEWIHNEFKSNGVISFKQHGLHVLSCYCKQFSPFKPILFK